MSGSFIDRIGSKAKKKSLVRSNAGGHGVSPPGPVGLADIFGEKLITADELADMLRLSTSAITRRVTLKQIPFVRIGNRVRFKPSKIAQWLSGNGKGELECVEIPSIPDRRTRKKSKEEAPEPAKKPKPQSNKKRGKK